MKANSRGMPARAAKALRRGSATLAFCRLAAAAGARYSAKTAAGCPTTTLLLLGVTLALPLALVLTVGKAVGRVAVGVWLARALRVARALPALLREGAPLLLMQLLSEGSAVGAPVAAELLLPELLPLSLPEATLLLLAQLLPLSLPEAALLLLAPLLLLQLALPLSLLLALAQPTEALTVLLGSAVAKELELALLLWLWLPLLLPLPLLLLLALLLPQAVRLAAEVA
jgi:hypothetical protein